MHHRVTEDTEKSIVLITTPQAQLSKRKLCVLCDSVVKYFVFGCQAI
jgi:hypothetical protein